MSSCARSSVAGQAAWGFVEFDALRVEHGLSVSRFCRAVGLPARTYYDRRARHAAGHQVHGPWPTPARDGIRAAVVELALKYPMWGHRKIAWLARHEHGLQVAEATCLRILREAGLILPVDYVRERRDLAGARREAFVELPTRRNRVWQMDFFELETSGGGRGGRGTSSTTPPRWSWPGRSRPRRRTAMRSPPCSSRSMPRPSCSAAR